MRISDWSSDVCSSDLEVAPEEPIFAFTYPSGATANDLAEADVAVEDVTTLPIRYMVGFRAQGEHLPTARRGARIYCNSRLDAGRSLFGFPNGRHNFHRQSYMRSEERRVGKGFVSTSRLWG